MFQGSGAINYEVSGGPSATAADHGNALIQFISGLSATGYLVDMRSASQQNNLIAPPLAYAGRKFNPCLYTVNPRIAGLAGWMVGGNDGSKELGIASTDPALLGGLEVFQEPLWVSPTLASTTSSLTLTLLSADFSSFASSVVSSATNSTGGAIEYLFEDKFLEDSKYKGTADLLALLSCNWDKMLMILGRPHFEHEIINDVVFI